ncbi:DUF2634 domain-containing protein [Listeria monocytogenes]
MEEEVLLEDQELVSSRTYKVVNGRIAGFVDDLEATRQAIEKILLTNRFEWSIYSDAYGSDVNDLIGEQMDLVKAEIERVITEALTADDRVSELVDFEILSETKDSLHVSFNIVTVFGNVAIEQEVSM